MVGIETTAAGALRAVRELRPDLALVDIGLPDRSGIAVGADILRERPETTLVAVTARDDPHLVKACLRAGFSGYLTKDASAGRFVRSLESILDGQLVVPQRLAKAVSAAEPEDHVRTTLDRLTPRERDVLKLLVDGGTSESIAEELSVTVATARTHIQNVLAKLQVHSRLEAATFAVRHGLVMVGPLRT